MSEEAKYDKTIERILRESPRKTAEGGGRRKGWPRTF